MPGARVAGLMGHEPDCGVLLGEEAQALHVRGAEGARLAERGRPLAGLVDLEAEGQIAGQEAEADRDPIGLQARADQVVEIMPMGCAKFLGGRGGKGGREDVGYQPS